jgi:hypothetical protein
MTLCFVGAKKAPFHAIVYLAISYPLSFIYACHQSQRKEKGLSLFCVNPSEQCCAETWDLASDPTLHSPTPQALPYASFVDWCQLSSKFCISAFQRVSQV